MNIKRNIQILTALAVSCSALLGCRSTKPAPPEYPLAQKIAKRDGTNYIGVYLGMIAEHDRKGGVAMFSATSGEMLRWISYDEFKAVYVDKTKPEYPR